MSPIFTYTEHDGLLLIFCFLGAGHVIPILSVRLGHLTFHLKLHVHPLFALLKGNSPKQISCCATVNVDYRRNQCRRCLWKHCGHETLEAYAVGPQALYGRRQKVSYFSLPLFINCSPFHAGSTMSQYWLLEQLPGKHVMDNFENIVSMRCWSCALSARRNFMGYDKKWPVFHCPPWLIAFLSIPDRQCHNIDYWSNFHARMS